MVVSSMNLILNRTTSTYGHDLLELDRPGIGTGYYQYDAQLSTRFLTDPAANIVNTYEYSAFGPFLTRNALLPNPFTYTGESFDPETELLYLRARYYYSKMARFISIDPVEAELERPFSLHLYVYTINNPMRWQDHSGEFAVAMTVTLSVLGGMMQTALNSQISVELLWRTSKLLLYYKKWIQDPAAQNCFYVLFKTTFLQERNPINVREHSRWLFRNPINKVLYCQPGPVSEVYSNILKDSKPPDIKGIPLLRNRLIFMHTHPLHVGARVEASPSSIDKASAKKLARYGTILYTIGTPVGVKSFNKHKGSGSVWKVVPVDLRFRVWKSVKEDDGTILKNLFCAEFPQKCENK